MDKTLIQSLDRTQLADFMSSMPVSPNGWGPSALVWGIMNPHKPSQLEAFRFCLQNSHHPTHTYSSIINRILGTPWITIEYFFLDLLLRGNHPFYRNNLPTLHHQHAPQDLEASPGCIDLITQIAYPEMNRINLGVQFTTMDMSSCWKMTGKIKNMRGVNTIESREMIQASHHRQFIPDRLCVAAINGATRAALIWEDKQVLKSAFTTWGNEGYNPLWPVENLPERVQVELRLFAFCYTFFLSHAFKQPSLKKASCNREHRELPLRQDSYTIEYTITNNNEIISYEFFAQKLETTSITVNGRDIPRTIKGDRTFLGMITLLPTIKPTA